MNVIEVRDPGAAVKIKLSKVTWSHQMAVVRDRCPAAKPRDATNLPSDVAG